MIGKSTFRSLDLPVKRQVVIFYGWLTVITIVLVVLFFGGQANQGDELRSEIQSQRRAATIRNCKKQNVKHHALFKELRQQREANRAQLVGNLLIEAERQSDQREALVATLEPWQDCVALANRNVR
jgi:hypothetical protein